MNHARQARRLAAITTILFGAVLGSGCTTTLIVAHVIDKLTEGAPLPCHRLNTVDRALQPRCGTFVEGSLQARDVAASGLPVCPLTLAARDPALWPVLPALIARGASPEACAEAPLAVLAREHPDAAFAAATPEQRDALRWLAEADTRAVQHDVMRLLSAPNARAAGLDRALDGWLAQGLLVRGTLAFSPLGALHPTHLHSPFARALELSGHRARDAFGGTSATLASGFDMALQAGDTIALDWWFERVPELARSVPAGDTKRMSWVPLARAITPGYQADADLREQTVIHLLARGADPSQRLPHDARLTVLGFAKSIRSPLVPMLEAHRIAGAAGRSIVAVVAAE